MWILKKSSASETKVLSKNLYRFKGVFESNYVDNYVDNEISKIVHD